MNDQPTRPPDDTEVLNPQEAPVSEAPAIEETPAPVQPELQHETAASENPATESTESAADGNVATEPSAEQPTVLSEAEAPVGEIPAVETTAAPQAPKTEKPKPTPEELQAANEERRKRAQAIWQRLVDAKSNGDVVEAIVKSTVKGGLLVDIEGYRGFLPASQAGVPKGAPLDTLVGTNVSLKVLDIDESRKRVVVSQRRAQQEQRRSERSALIKSLKVGEERDAKVVRLADFGAFVELGSGVDALIPASELAFERVDKPSDVVKVGDEFKVRVLRIDQNGKKIAVSRKGALADPWRDNAALLQRGKKIDGKVVAKERGLDVEVAPGIVGSISDREANPDEYEIGETVEVTVRNADFRARRLRLSLAHTAAVTMTSSTSFAPLGAELRIPTSDQS